MMKKIAWFISDENITINFDNQTHIIPVNSPQSFPIIEAIRNKNYDTLPDLINATKIKINNYGNGSFEVKNNDIYVNGNKVPNELSKKILRFIDEGLPHEPLVKFSEKLLENPSYRAVNELFGFLSKNDHPITEDGNFIAYKRVNSDYTDMYTRTMDNSPGKEVSMPRNQVNEDANQTCSFGLHVANWNYASNLYNAGNGILIEVEVNPADVVAVPVDYDNAKMRVCKYKVLKEVDVENSSEAIRYTSTSKISYENNQYYSDEEDSENDWTDDDSSSEEDEDTYPFDDELE